MNHPLSPNSYQSGHSEQEGRVYQLGSGLQLNAETISLSDIGKDSRFSIRTPFTTVRIGSTDAYEMGVHRAESRHDGLLPEYVQRTVDAQLRRRISQAREDGGFVLLVGDSTAGKTRAAFEALLAFSPEANIWAPIDGRDLVSHMQDIVESGSSCFLWLDDLERYIGPDGLTPATAGLLKNFRVPVIATMRAEQYRRLSPVGRRVGEDSHEHGHYALGSRLLQQLDPIFLPRIWDANELERARRAGDSRVSGAANHAEIFGIAEYLAAGPRLYEEWSLAWTAEGNPRGAAIVAAAVDCARAGLANDIPLTLLVDLHHAYLAKQGGDLLRPEPLDTALEWATTRHYGITSLLLPIRAGFMYRVFDYLPDAMARRGLAPKIPAETWEAVLQYAIPEGLSFHVGMAAIQHREWPVAEKAWEGALEANPIPARVNLGRVYVRTDRRELAKNVWREASDLGSLDAAIYLGGLHEKDGNISQAIALYLRGAEKGDDHSIQHLAYATPDDEESADWWLKVADSDASGRSAFNLGQCYARLGDLTSAKRWWKSAADRGYSHAMHSYGLQLKKEGMEKEAHEWIKRGADEGSTNAMVTWAQHLIDEKRRDEGSALLHKAVELGGASGLGVLGYMHLQDGELAQAKQFWQRGMKAGDSISAFNLGMTLDNEGDLVGAEEAYRAADCSKNPSAALHLSLLLAKQGDIEEAEINLRYGLDRTDGWEICNFGISLLERGYLGRAHYWLHVAFLRGHTHAATGAGLIYLRAGFNSEAERLLSISSLAGNLDAKNILSTELARQGRGAEAAKVLRFFGQGEKAVSASSGRKKRPQRPKRRKKK
ncbi:tetratricopeptide repeat protein [Streptomyces lichenis]|uniref:Tetratricopeptide repeat protein n=1 Tax=Streptomyces lichenis TaxID=2306967 RepID=A0ABT0I537_9ACTN|nr:tetratricopeptide repeat protein [Streptomyces lichenis]MCK8676425.1 tetratricopeptide repeat protein [Streptomyces lichenis]